MYHRSLLQVDNHFLSLFGEASANSTLLPEPSVLEDTLRGIPEYSEEHGDVIPLDDECTSLLDGATTCSFLTLSRHMPFIGQLVPC
jgi:hypothetical protein